jgi:hypothetical protein
VAEWLIVDWIGRLQEEGQVASGAARCPQALAPQVLETGPLRAFQLALPALVLLRALTPCVARASDQTMFLLYPGVSSTIFKMLVCRDIEGTVFLAADFTIKCTDDKWLAYLAPTIVAIIVYPLGVPAVLLQWLWRYKKR